jgi:hypothetical protein
LQPRHAGEAGFEMGGFPIDFGALGFKFGPLGFDPLGAIGGVGLPDGEFGGEAVELGGAAIVLGARSGELAALGFEFLLARGEFGAPCFKPLVFGGEGGQGGEIDGGGGRRRGRVGRGELRQFGGRAPVVCASGWIGGRRFERGNRVGGTLDCASCWKAAGRIASG